MIDLLPGEAVAQRQAGRSLPARTCARCLPVVINLLSGEAVARGDLVDVSKPGADVRCLSLVVVAVYGGKSFFYVANRPKRRKSPQTSQIALKVANRLKRRKSHQTS